MRMLRIYTDKLYIFEPPSLHTSKYFLFNDTDMADVFFMHLFPTFFI